MIGFLRTLRDPRRESPDLLAERAAQFALECRRLRKQSGVASRYVTLDLQTFPAWIPGKYRAMAGVLACLAKSPTLLAIGGERGTGKTGLGCALVNTFCDLGRPAIYCRAFDLFESLSSAPWERKRDIRTAFRKPDLLVMDEVQVRDADRVWQDNELTTLIDGRYADEKATVLLSNFTPEALEANVGPSIWRRLIEQGGVYETEWPGLEQCWSSNRGVA